MPQPIKKTGNVANIIAFQVVTNMDLSHDRPLLAQKWPTYRTANHLKSLIPQKALGRATSKS